MAALKKLRCCIKDNTILPPASVLDKNGNELTQVKTSSGEILWGKYNVKVLDKTSTYTKVTDLANDWYKDSSMWDYYFTKVIKNFNFYTNEPILESNPDIYFSAWNVPAYRNLFSASWDTERGEVTTTIADSGSAIYHGEKITKEAELRPEAGFYFIEAINPTDYSYGNSSITREVVSQADGDLKIDWDSLKIEPRYGTLQLENSTGFNFQCGLDRVSSLKQNAKIGTVLDGDSLYYGDSFLYDVNDVADAGVPYADTVYPEVGDVIECSLTNVQDGNGNNFTEISPNQKVSYFTERGSRISFDLSPKYPLYFETTPEWKTTALPSIMGVDGQILSTTIMDSAKGISLEANLVINPYYPKNSINIPIYFYSSNREFSIADTKITNDNSSSSVVLTTQNIQEVPEDDFSKAVWSHLVTKRQVAVKKDAYYTVLDYGTSTGITGLPPKVRVYSLSKPSYCYFNYTNNGYLYHVDLVDNPGKTTIIENQDI